MSLTVLICDDAVFIREILIQICQEQGHHIVGEASNGEEAVSMAQKLHPQMIFMDMVMPLKNGVDATKEILSFSPHTSIVACTTVNEDFLKRKALLSGCITYITKPFAKSDIIMALDFAKTNLKGKKHG